MTDELNKRLNHYRHRLRNMLDLQKQMEQDHKEEVERYQLAIICVLATNGVIYALWLVGAFS